MKKIIIILIFSIISFYTPASAAIKSGNTCKKSGQTIVVSNSPFACMKVKKKLVWTSYPDVIKLYKSWSKPEFSNQISVVARNNFQIWAHQNQSGPERLRISLNPQISESDVQYLIKTMNLASKSLLKESDPTPHVYISVGDDWAIKQLGNDYSQYKNFNGPNLCYPPNPTAGCAWTAQGLMFFISQNITDWQTQQRGVINSGAHEFFHLIQEILVKNQRGVSGGTIFSNIPAWFFEGSASFVGTAYTDLAAIYPWQLIRDDEILYYRDGRGTNEPLESFQLNSLDRPQPEAQSHRPYGIGMLACEFIVASVGMEKYLQIYKELGAGKNFSDAFETSTGMPLKDFYMKFDEYRTAIGFYPVKN